MSRSINVTFTGLTAIVRRRKGAKPRSQVMDTIMVKPLMMKMKSRRRRDAMPPHYPVLIAPKGSVRMEPPHLLAPPNASTVDLPKDTEAWLLSGFEIRFPGASKRQRPVAHVADRLTLGSGVVRTADLDDFSPLTMMADITNAGEAPFDAQWLGSAGAGAQSPVGARVRLSGGSIRCEPRLRSQFAYTFWQLKSDEKAFPGRPMAEIAALSYRGRSTEIKLEVATLKGKVVGSLYLLVSARDFEFRNFPKPAHAERFRVGNGVVPHPVGHFDAFYNLLKRPVRRPVPFYWGRRVVTRAGRLTGRLVVAAEESGRQSSKDNRTGEASCPLGVLEN